MGGPQLWVLIFFQTNEFLSNDLVMFASLGTCLHSCPRSTKRGPQMSKKSWAQGVLVLSSFIWQLGLTWGLLSCHRLLPYKTGFNMLISVRRPAFWGGGVRGSPASPPAVSDKTCRSGGTAHLLGAVGHWNCLPETCFANSSRSLKFTLFHQC